MSSGNSMKVSPGTDDAHHSHRGVRSLITTLVHCLGSKASIAALGNHSGLCRRSQHVGDAHHDDHEQE